MYARDDSRLSVQVSVCSDDVADAPPPGFMLIGAMDNYGYDLGSAWACGVSLEDCTGICTTMGGPCAGITFVVSGPQVPFLMPVPDCSLCLVPVHSRTHGLIMCTGIMVLVCVHVWGFS